MVSQNLKEVEVEESRNKLTNNKVSKNGEQNTLKDRMIFLKNFSTKLTIKNNFGQRKKKRNKINLNLRSKNRKNKRAFKKNNNKRIKKQR